MKIRRAKKKTKNNKSFSSSIFIKLICGAIWPDKEHVHPACCSHFISRTMFHGTGGVLKKSMPRNSLNPCLLRRTAWQFQRSSSTSPFLILRMSCVTKTIAMKAMWATEFKMEPLTKKKKFCEEVAVVEPHSKWKNAASKSKVPDYLKLLYPHDRDGDCFMEEVHHKYYVHNLPYPCSVSDVWKVFFPEFDDTMTIQTCLAKWQNLGLMNLESSAYNLYLFLIYFRRLSPGDETFWSAVNEVCASAKQHASRAWCMSSNDSLDDAITQAVQEVITSPWKPVGRSCYFLSLCAGCCSSSLKATWSFNGDLESFKGTFLHKQAECYMQQLAQWQHENNKTHVRLGDMFCNIKVMEAVRSACRPSEIMRKLAPTTSASLWNHPATQRWLQEQLESCCSPELYRFVAWTYANPNLTPFRSEWSIYNEDFDCHVVLRHVIAL